LHSQLGRGGFAPVWLASEVYDDIELRSVAVKLFAFAPGELSAPTRRYREHVIREARALCQVEHPNIVRFYSLVIEGELGLVALVMEYLRGESLSDRLSSAGRLELGETLEIGLAVASALEAAHAAGIVHRDVKPANVMRSEEAYKLIDFGISADEELEPQQAAEGARKVVLEDLPLDAVGTKLTVGRVFGAKDESTLALAAAASGTVGYIDPACVAGAPAVFASDLYSLGALLFQCASGVLPAVAAAGGDKLRGEVLDGRVRPPRIEELAPETPAPLSELIHHLLAPDRLERPGSAAEVVRRLRGLQSVPERSTSAVGALATDGDVRRSSRRGLVLGLGAALVAVGIAFVALREREGARDSAAGADPAPESTVPATASTNGVAAPPAERLVEKPIVPEADGGVEAVASPVATVAERKPLVRRNHAGTAPPAASAAPSASPRETAAVPPTELVPKDEF
jgi:serine/threonine protein kinase